MRASVIACALVLAAVGAATAAAAPTARSCTPTASDGFGPFGQGGAAPVRTVYGKGFVLRGRVLRSLDCTPLAGAVVEVWQATKGGVYDARGRASTTTGPRGTFRFTGPAPVAYEGIAPHIHVRISHPGFDDVATTVRINRGQRTATFEVVLTSTL